MKRTTVYLTDELKARLEQAAQSAGVTEAEVIRQALAERLSERPTLELPLFETTGTQTTIAEDIDAGLVGFGDR